jgi:hypothetical protein
VNLASARPWGGRADQPPAVQPPGAFRSTWPPSADRPAGRWLPADRAPIGPLPPALLPQWEPELTARTSGRANSARGPIPALCTTGHRRKRRSDRRRQGRQRPLRRDRAAAALLAPSPPPGSRSDFRKTDRGPSFQPNDLAQQTTSRTDNQP